MMNNSQIQGSALNKNKKNKKRFLPMNLHSNAELN